MLPPESKFKRKWNVLISGLVIYNTIFVILVICFNRYNYLNGLYWYSPDTGKLNWAPMIIDYVIDLIFIADMGMQFLLGYSRSDASQGLVWIFEPRSIATHYMTSGWFPLDVISICSSIPDIARIEGVEDLTIVRIVRVIRLTKLVRVLRGSRLFKRWEIRFSIDYTMLSLGSSMTSIMICTHWFACIWGLQASFNPLGSWPAAQGFCEEFASGAQADVQGLVCPEGMVCDYGKCDGGVCSGGWVCFGAWTLYVESLYVAVATCTSGGAYVAAFDNTSEKAIATLMVLFSGVLWSQLIGVLCAVASNLSPTKQAFRKDLTELNTFMSNHSLDPRTCLRLREYLHESLHMKNAASQKRILAQLSPGLHSEVVWRITHPLLRSVRFLQGVEKELLIALAFRINARVFPPEEICPHGALYIIFKGTALYAGKLHKSGMCFGEDILMQRPDFISPSHGVAVTYLWLYTLDGKVIRDTLMLYPDSSLQIRTINMRWMMARMIIRASRHIKELRRSLSPEQASSMDPFALLKHKPPRAEITVDNDSGDGKAAAQRYAAQYAQREAQAQSDGDRISQLSKEMLEMKKAQHEVIKLLSARRDVAGRHHLWSANGYPSDGARSATGATSSNSMSVNSMVPYSLESKSYWRVTA